MSSEDEKSNEKDGMELNQQQQYKFAYLRENNSDRYELTFFLETETPRLCEEMSIILLKCDTISSLISSIKEKLEKLLQDRIDREVKENNSVEAIPVSLKRGKKCLKGGMILKNFPSSLSNESKNDVILEVLDQKFVVSLNAPLIKEMKLPHVIYANFIVQPVKLISIFTDKKNSTFAWYKSMDRTEWKKCGANFQYSVEMEDVGHYLKLVCVPRNNEKIEGPIAEIVSEAEVQVMQEFTSFPFEKRHDLTKEKLQGPNFRIVSYNILSERYTLMEDNYDYCDPRFLSVDYRKQVILKELLGFNADIICLQEVDNRHFSAYFKTKFRENGYRCLFHRKGNRIPEGFTFAFNQSRFKQHDSKHIVFGIEIERHSVFSYLWDVVKRNSDLRSVILTMPTSMQVTILKSKEAKPDRFLIIGNAHFTYKPESDYLRLLHMNMATTYVEMMARKCRKSGYDVAVIYCGDFNSEPEKSLYQYMTQNRIDSSHEDCLKIDERGKTELYHKLEIESACGTPKYTNYTRDFKGCLDYIFIQSDKLAVERVIPLTEEQELAKYEGLPNEYFPSDHLSLVVDLKFKEW